MATPREQLAELLRQARLDAGFGSHGELARKLNVSRPVITRAENPAHPVPSDAVLAAWAGATGAGLDVLTDLAQRARSGPPGWFAKWADIEARASLIRWFEPLLVPGLIQTESYARAVLAWKPDSASAEVNLKNRLARQSVLDRAELRVVILESVLYREVGDAATMGEQVQHPPGGRESPVRHVAGGGGHPGGGGRPGRRVRHCGRGRSRRSCLRGIEHPGRGVHRPRPDRTRQSGVRWPACGRATVDADPRSS